MSLTTSGSCRFICDERFLHPLDVGARRLDEGLPMAQIRAQRDDPVVGPKAPAEQADAVELAQPLAIRHVALAARDILDVARVDEEHLEAARLEELVDRDPIHARRFHRDARHPARGEPVGEPVQIGREGRERAHRGGVAIRRHRDEVLGRPAIDARDIRIDPLEHASATRAACPANDGDCVSSTAPPYCPEHPGAGRRRGEQSPKRDQARVIARVTNDAAATPRATLKDGLVQHHWGVGLGSRMRARFCSSTCRDSSKP